MKKVILTLSIFLTSLLLSFPAFAHCEIPCGIYDDQARVKEIHEHVETITKSMDKISKLSIDGDRNYNQLIRWVNNKEEHANKIQHIATQYFMTQRIKPANISDEAAYSKYITELSLMHQIVVQAMKSKQTIDTTHPEQIHNLLKEFSGNYFGEAAKGSMK